MSTYAPACLNSLNSNDSLRSEPCSPTTNLYVLKKHVFSVLSIYNLSHSPSHSGIDRKMAKARHWPINCCWCNTRCASLTLCRDRLVHASVDCLYEAPLITVEAVQRICLKSWVSDKRCPEARNVPLRRTIRFRTWARCARLKDHLSLWQRFTTGKCQVQFPTPGISHPRVAIQKRKVQENLARSNCHCFVSREIPTGSQTRWTHPKNANPSSHQSLLSAKVNVNPFIFKFIL